MNDKEKTEMNDEKEPALVDQLPTPYELATLAARIAKPHSDGVDDAMRLLQFSIDALNHIRRCPYFEPAYLRAGLSVFEAAIKSRSNFEEMLEPGKYMYSLEEALKKLKIRSKATLFKLIEQAYEGHTVDEDLILRINDHEKGDKRLIGFHEFKTLMELQRKKRAEIGRQNRLKASLPRKKRKPVK